MAKEKKDLVVAEEEVKDLSIYSVEDGNEEHLSQDELEIPFLKLTQKGSDEVDPDKAAKYIEGLKPGDFFNTVSKEVYGSELKMQVHGYFHKYNIWEGPKGKGTYMGSMSTDEFRAFEKTAEPPLVRDGGDMVHTVDGKALRYTDTHSFIISLPEHMEEGVMIYPLSSTGCKVARTWNTLNNGQRNGAKQLKRFATIWGLKTAGFESKGFPYKQVSSVKPLGRPTPELLAYGASLESFAQSIKKTGVKFSENHEAVAEAEDSAF